MTHATNSEQADVFRYLGTEHCIALLPQRIQDAYRAHMIFADQRTLDDLKRAIEATKAG
jgi:hypothetical protein